MTRAWKDFHSKQKNDNLIDFRFCVSLGFVQHRTHTCMRTAHTAIATKKKQQMNNKGKKRLIKQFASHKKSEDGNNNGKTTMNWNE